MKSHALTGKTASDLADNVYHISAVVSLQQETVGFGLRSFDSYVARLFAIVDRILLSNNVSGFSKTCLFES